MSYVDPIIVTFREHPTEDRVFVYHDNVLAWEENSWGKIDQYFAHFMPKSVPVVLYWSNGMRLNDERT